VHLEADDLAAEQVEDEVKIEPASLHLCRKEGETLSANAEDLVAPMR
jgi:hypothetical protein